jgi:tetratricopeptide (TPR) repeat protein
MNTITLGFQAIGKRDYQEAINIFKRALDHKHESKAYLGFGTAHLHLGDFLTARWAFSKALELDPANKEATALLAKAVDTRKPKHVPERRSFFRTGEGYLEVHDKVWKRFFMKGINLGLGIPGYFPGEFAIKKGTYLKWFQQMSELGVNAVRIYTVHPPDFYCALHEFNRSGKRLYLLQGIWTELPARNDFLDERFMAGFKQEMQNAVDVVYGNANLPEQPGHAHGAYEYDVSPYTAAFIVGREWESCSVKEYNELNQRALTDYAGAFLGIRRGNPFEVWVARVCDFLQQYEHAHYHASHPVTTVNWPTLDPLTHPSESTYEDEYRLQGITARGTGSGCVDVHIEDVETLDLAKITAKKGNGFFALYHAYPYYPDFMNHDYQEKKNTYRAYLEALKQHHGKQPVVIAEFGVPASRESAHWHRDGWNQGGHPDVKQGEINGLLMHAIHDSGMAGGILFSWFDEWFKKNWLFQPYELPADRKPFWFNLQDPEENYGLVATYPGYPGKTARLTGRAEDWNNARIMYEKQDISPAFRFNDGYDDARLLLRLAAQHDEGFLYLLLETKGPIDFTKAHYLIGLNTGASDVGERLFPFETNLQSPVGLDFVIHLAGKNKSRILAAQSYDKYLNEKTGLIRPMASDQGAWVMMINRTNIRRISKDGKRFFPSHVSFMSRLQFGSLEAHHADYNSLADFHYSGTTIELRIPWGLINVTDPSSKTVLWMDKAGETKSSSGISLVAVSYKPEDNGIIAQRTGNVSHHTSTLPAKFDAGHVKTYTWEGWDTPIYHSYLKESYYRYQKILHAIPEAP